MSEQGWVTAVIQRDLGSRLYADAAAGAAELVIDYAGDFDDEGTLSLNGTQLAYVEVVSGEGEDDPDTLTLAAPLAVAATEGDLVSVVLAGQVATEMVARVSLGDGDAAEIEIPFEQRIFWPVGDYEPVVPVEVSDDLMKIETVPNREPVAKGAALGIRFLNTDTFTAAGPGDLTCPLTYVPITGSEDVKVDGIGQAGHWTRSGRLLTLLDPDGFLEADNEVTVEYAYDQTNATAAIVPTFRDVAPQQLNGWTVPALTQPGDLLVAVAMMPDTESVTVLNGWTFAGASEYVTHTAVGPGVRTYRMEIYTVRADGSGAVPTVSNAVAQDVVCSMIAFADGGSVTAVFDTLTDGTAANAPAQDPTSLRVWGTIGNAVTITPSRGQVVLSTDYTEIDTAMSVDPDPSAAPAIASGPAGWCLASMVVSP